MEKRKYWFFGVAFALSLVADQASKIWARAALKGHGAQVVVADWFDFRYSENPGVAFGMLRDVSFARYLLPLIGVVALVVIYSFLKKTRPDRVRLALWLGLLAGGAVGNIADRVLYQRVTDFIVWKAPMQSLICRAIAKVMELFNSELRMCEWPTFNIADAALVIGVIALLIDARSDDMEPAPR